MKHGLPNVRLKTHGERTLRMRLPQSSGHDVTIERLGLEACSLTAWLHEELTRAGLPAICIETRQGQCSDEDHAEQDGPQ